MDPGETLISSSTCDEDYITGREGIDHRGTFTSLSRRSETDVGRDRQVRLLSRQNEDTNAARLKNRDSMKA